MARKKIQGPMLAYLLEHAEGVRAADLARMVKANSSSVSGALNRLKGNGVIEQRFGNKWFIKDREEAIWLTKNTYHTKNREVRVVGVMAQTNGEVKMGDLFEMIGRLRDGSRLVRTLDSGIVFKLEEV